MKFFEIVYFNFPPHATRVQQGAKTVKLLVIQVEMV